MRQLKRMVQKNLVAVLIGSMIVIAFIMAVIFAVRVPGREYAFDEGFHITEEIGRKYNASFKTEMLNETMPAVGDIPLLLKDIREFEETLDKRSKNPDMQALFLFLDIRKLMLTSQWYFLQGQALGDAGLVKDEGGFSCREAQQIIDAAFYYNESFTHGFYAEEEIDDLLYIYRYHPALWNTVGTNENKTRFFKSDLRHIRHIPLYNLKSLEAHCGITGIEHKTGYAPFPYERKVIPKEAYGR